MQMPIENLVAFPPAGNPYLEDHENMGEDRGLDLHMMYGNNLSEDCKYLILIQKSTGKRVKINLPEIFKNAPAYQAVEDNKKLHTYLNRCVKIEYLYGGEQTAMAVAEGFIWTSSTDTHDVFKNREFQVLRYINKHTKNFYEVQQ